VSGGFDAARLGRIEPWLNAALARHSVPGAIAMIARGDQVHVFTAGASDVESGTPMTRDTIIRIASMTKPITVTAALMLVEEARIALDDPVEQWLPELANRKVLRAIDSPVDDTELALRSITLRDLLTFRAGIGAIMKPPGTYPIQREMEALGIAPGPDAIGISPDEYMAKIGALPLLHQPGERWMYHTAIEVLSVLIARVVDEPLEQFLEERIFAPLGMEDTGFVVPASKRDRFATCYVLWSERLARWDTPDGQFSRSQIFPSEVVSTADDYLRFARMLLRHGEAPHGRLLSRASVLLMMADQLTAEQKDKSPFPGLWDGSGWGMGGRVVTRRTDIDIGPGAYGWSGGYGTHFVIDPCENLFATVLTQRMMQSPGDDRIGRELFTLTYAALDS